MVYFSIYLFYPPFLLKMSTYCCVMYLVIFAVRNEKNELFLGIRRASQRQTMIPSSVLSSDSMHIGLLAAAAHAAATNSCFTVFYNPRFYFFFVLPFAMLYLNHDLLLTAISWTGLVRLSLLFPYQNISKQCIIRVFRSACGSECYLRQMNQAFAGTFILNLYVLFLIVLNFCFYRSIYNLYSCYIN